MKPTKVFIYSYTRDKHGVVTRYNPRPIANTVHSFTGGGWTTDQFVAMLYET